MPRSYCWCLFNWFALVPIARRQELLLDTFTARKSKGLAGSLTPFAIFVKKLQESLTRMEAFDVVTVTQGMDGALSSTYVQTHILMTCRRFEAEQFTITSGSATTSTLGCFRRI